MDESVGQLDVKRLLESSRPRARVPWFWYVLGALLLLILLSAYVGDGSNEGAALLRLVQQFGVIALLGALAFSAWSAMRWHRGEQHQLEAAEELIQLRRWTEAATVLEQLLSRPSRTPQTRIQGLIFLTSVLARFNRFADAITVQDAILDEAHVDPATDHALRVGRAMAMLREDHLFDADRAISELRRGPAGEQSAGLALVEIYRDVKTGHPAEAIEIFNSRLQILRDQLGHRAGDAYALVARARDLLGQTELAQQAYENATLLGAPEELHRRYPELDALNGRYTVAPAP